MQILTWHDKHGDFHYDASTTEKLHEAALKILTERVEYSYLNDEDEQQAKEIISRKDGVAAYDMLRKRREYEYERISLADVK